MTPVSGRFSESMTISEPVMERMLDKICVVDCAMVAEMLSTSLLRRLMVSPWGRVSKNLSGRCWGLSKNAPRKERTSRWEALSISVSQSVDET